MKKYIAIIFCVVIFSETKAQNEGRIGIFTGINNTTLLNKDDKAFGDFLPTFKSNVGIDGAYHFTLFKTLAAGIGSEMSYTSTGQNYSGSYQDSTSYYAYSRLQYVRFGMFLHLGTPLRRSVAISYGSGFAFGFLTGYQDRYELIRYNNSRLIADVRNQNIDLIDSSTTKATINEPLYNRTDLTLFNKLGLDFLIGDNFVLSIYGRYDMGMSSVENHMNHKIIIQSEPATTQDFVLHYQKIKYRQTSSLPPERSITTNNFGGVYFSLRYRIWNKDKTEFWYKQRQLKSR